jgi:hypothetical protein
MSEHTKRAIYSRLTGDIVLCAMLATDAGGNIAIYNASYNKANPAIFPCITFREADGSADQRVTGGTVDTEYFDLEIWARTESALVVPQIAGRMDVLLHNQTLSLTSGVNYNCSRVAQAPDQWDDKNKLHFGLYRYKLVVGR